MILINENENRPPLQLITAVDNNKLITAAATTTAKPIRNTIKTI